jgi:hypothetical protein
VERNHAVRRVDHCVLQAGIRKIQAQFCN